MAKSKAGSKGKQKSKQRIGPENGRWRGGEISQGGYRKTRAPDHPKADSSGYVYTHRLRSDVDSGTQQVHHKDGDRSNNSPSNLKVEPNLSVHNTERAKDKKKPTAKKPAKKPSPK